MQTVDRHNPVSRDSFGWWCWFSLQRAVAFLALVALAPLMLVLYIAVRVDSRGGFIYKQLRPGRAGVLFNAYKIRTMTVGADRNPMLARAVAADAPEVTRIGHVLRETKLDELPQLWNIVRGDMALVGPRPIAVPLYEHLAEAVPGFSQRLSVHPGLTSLAQVCIKENAAVEDVVQDWSMRFEGERHYMANQSVLYDLVILGLTLRFLLFKAARTFSSYRSRRQDEALSLPRSRA